MRISAMYILLYNDAAAISGQGIMAIEVLDQVQLPMRLQCTWIGMRWRFKDDGGRKPGQMHGPVLIHRLDEIACHVRKACIA